MALGQSEKPVFSLVHGRHHCGEHWMYLRDELRELGWESIAPTLPVEVGKYTFDTHSDFLAQAEAESGAKEFIRVGHSWGANIIPRQLPVDGSVRALIFLSGVFHPATLPHIPETTFPKVKHSALYEIIKSNPDLYLHDLAGDTFYQQTEDPEIKAWAIELLRTHPRVQPETNLAIKPDLPAVYIRTSSDYTVQQESQSEMASAWGIETVEFEGDHGSMISHPEKLAKELVRQAVLIAN